MNLMIQNITKKIQHDGIELRATKWMATISIYVYQGGAINYVATKLISFYQGRVIEQVVKKLIPLY
jgi:hypothetical protein